MRTLALTLVLMCSTAHAADTADLFYGPTSRTLVLVERALPLARLEKLVENSVVADANLSLWVGQDYVLRRDGIVDSIRLKGHDQIHALQLESGFVLVLDFSPPELSARLLSPSAVILAYLKAQTHMRRQHQLEDYLAFDGEALAKVTLSAEELAANFTRVPPVKDRAMTLEDLRRCEGQL